MAHLDFYPLIHPKMKHWPSFRDYFDAGYTYELVCEMLSAFHSITMSLCMLKSLLRVAGLYRRKNYLNLAVFPVFPSPGTKVMHGMFPPVHSSNQRRSLFLSFLVEVNLLILCVFAVMFGVAVAFCDLPLLFVFICCIL